MRSVRVGCECGSTLVEACVAAVIIAVIALGLFQAIGAQRANTLRAVQQAQAIAIAQGRLDSILADFSRGDASPLYTNLPKDFTLRYVTASGSQASPWNLFTGSTTEAITIGAQTGFNLRTTVQYIDDTLDGVSPTDTDPYDAVRINVSIVPTQQGAVNPYEHILLETLWYR